MAKKIDTKIDDANPVSGNFTADSGCDEGICLLGNEYTDLSSNEFGCRGNIVLRNNL